MSFPLRVYGYPACVGLTDDAERFLGVCDSEDEVQELLYLNTITRMEPLTDASWRKVDSHMAACGDKKLSVFKLRLSPITDFWGYGVALQKSLDNLRDGQEFTALEQKQLDKLYSVFNEQDKT